MAGWQHGTALAQGQNKSLCTAAGTDGVGADCLSPVLYTSSKFKPGVHRESCCTSCCLKDEVVNTGACGGACKPAPRVAQGTLGAWPMADTVALCKRCNSHTFRREARAGCDKQNGEDTSTAARTWSSWLKHKQSQGIQNRDMLPSPWPGKQFGGLVCELTLKVPAQDFWGGGLELSFSQMNL